jgi:hypothetical protein
MKKMLAFLFVFLVNTASFCVWASEGMTIVSGHVNKGDVRSISLFQVIEGKKVEYASTRLDADKNFGFALLSVKEGFYYLAEPSQKAFTRIYLKSGDR